MSEVVVETLPYPTQKILYNMQDSMLPLLESLTDGADHVNHAGAELFRHEGDLGSLVVHHASEMLHVEIAEPFKQTAEGFDIPPIELKTEYTKRPDGTIVPSPLYTRLGFVVIMKAQHADMSSRYVPVHWPNGGSSLDSTQYGSLRAVDILRIQHVVGSIVDEVSVVRQKESAPELRIVGQD